MKCSAFSHVNSSTKTCDSQSHSSTFASFISVQLICLRFIVCRDEEYFSAAHAYLYWSSWVRVARVLLIALFCFLRRCRNPQVPRTINSAALLLITMQSLACRIAIQQTPAAAHEMHAPHIFPRTRFVSHSSSRISLQFEKL